MAAADFDGDGDDDIVCGTVGTAAYLVYYENDGTGHFSRNEIAIPDATCVAVVGILAEDFTGDGRPDIFVATDSAYGSVPQARIWFLRNRGLVSGDVDWRFQCLNACTAPTPSPYDIDMATPLDYDNDGDMDIVIADANHSGDYYYIENELAGVYETDGQAQSTNIGAGLLDPRLHAVTRVRVSSIRQGVFDGSSDGLTVEVLFSNNGGRSWETYHTFAGAEISNTTGAAHQVGLNHDGWYDFNNFGADLRWKIRPARRRRPDGRLRARLVRNALRRRASRSSSSTSTGGNTPGPRPRRPSSRRAASTRSSSSARPSSSRAGRASSGPTTSPGSPSSPDRAPSSRRSPPRTSTTPRAGT